MRALSTTSDLPSACPRIPTTVPSSMITLSTVKASRSSAPAAAAASTRILSSTVRRGAIVVACPLTARGRPVMVTGPKSNVERSIGGHPVVRTGSSRPHRSNAATPAGWMTSVDSVSLGKVERSTRSTRSPPAGQEHRGRGACTAGTDHDGVVVITIRWHDLIVAAPHRASGRHAGGGGERSGGSCEPARRSSPARTSQRAHDGNGRHSGPGRRKRATNAPDSTSDHPTARHRLEPETHPTAECRARRRRSS